MDTKTTSFEPKIHGFKFGNGFPVKDLIQFFPFLEILNSYGLAPDSFGLCGGMCWAALDYYYAMKPIPSNSSPPTKEDPLLETLAKRQFDTLKYIPPPVNRYQLIETLLIWQNSPFIGVFTADLSWPMIKAKIDVGLPAPICLVRAGLGVEVWKNHQVIAIGYKFNEEDNYLEIYLYDPNYPRTTQKLTMFLGQSNLVITHSTGKSARGFFLWPYDKYEKVIPEQIAPLSPSDIPWFWLTMDSSNCLSTSGN